MRYKFEKYKTLVLKKYKISKIPRLTFSKADPVFNNVILGVYLNKLVKRGCKNIIESAFYKKIYLVNCLLKYTGVLFLFFNLVKLLNISFIFLTKKLRNSTQKIPILLNFTSAMGVTFKSLVNLTFKSNFYSSLQVPIIKNLFLKLIFFTTNSTVKSSMFNNSLAITKSLLGVKGYAHYR